MQRNLKALCLAVLAILAMSAVAASAASANPQFHFEMEDTTLTGSQGQVVANTLTFDQGELKCKSVKFSGTSGAVTTTTLTLRPKYEECKLAGENAVVTVNGCGYLFHLAENEENFEAAMSIECPDGQKLEVDSPECTITIPPQAGLKEVTFTNEGEMATRSIVADLGVSGFHYVEDGAGCASEEETTNNGTYSGQITVTGENAGGEHKGIWVE
jgi:opacity protein-like surface antigen